MKDGDVYNLPGTYELSGNYLQITLDKEVMAHLMGDKAANIPAISFKYDIRGKQMTMYFDKVYLQVIYSMMENQIAAMIVDGNRFQPDAGRHGSHDYERGKKSAGRNFDTNP